MKRIISFLIMSLLIFSLAGCKPAQKNNKMIKNTFGVLKSASQSVHLILYFPDKNGNFLSAEGRVAEIHKSIEQTIAEEVIKGPAAVGHRPSVDKGIRVISVGGDKDILALNLSKGFLKSLSEGRKKAEEAVYSIVNSITELPGIRGVLFKVEGKTPSKTYDLDFNKPFERNRKLLNRKRGLTPAEVLKKEMTLEKLGKWLESYQMMSDDGNDKNRKYYEAYLSEMEEMKEKGFLDVDFKVGGYMVDKTGKKARVMVTFYKKDQDGKLESINTAYFNCVNIDGVWMVDWITTQ